MKVLTRNIARLRTRDDSFIPWVMAVPDQSISSDVENINYDFVDWSKQCDAKKHGSLIIPKVSRISQVFVKHVYDVIAITTTTHYKFTAKSHAMEFLKSSRSWRC